MDTSLDGCQYLLMNVNPASAFPLRAIASALVQATENHRDWLNACRQKPKLMCFIRGIAIFSRF